jgi:hypothetical protein
MTDMQHEGDKVLHQDSVEEVSEAVVDDAIADLSTHVAIADCAVPASVGYVQAEATETRTKLNAVLAVLRDLKAIPSS